MLDQRGSAVARSIAEQDQPTAAGVRAVVGVVSARTSAGDSLISRRVIKAIIFKIVVVFRRWLVLLIRLRAFSYQSE